MGLLDAPWWLLLLAVIGTVAIVTVLLSLFTGIGDRADGASITDDFAVDSDEFIHGLAGNLNSPLQQGGTARLLNNGDEFFPAILRSIREAQGSVNFMTYIWQPGEMSDRFFAALIEKAREGIPVRVLADGFGGMSASDRRIEELCRAGGRWAWFHPPRFGQLMRLHKRNHRRAIIVDGRVGYTGGAAVADRWLGDAQDPDHWRDCMVEVRGCIATNLQSAFAQLWSHVTGEMLAGPALFPTSHDGPGPSAGSGEPISRHINVVSSPSTDAHPLRRLFWMSFRSARQRIYITNPYFVPDDVSRAVLKERVAKGVDVRVLVPGEHIDYPFLRWASHSHYEELLAAGVRIFEYQPTMIHQKLLVIDGVWSVVGSANLDVRSKELNQENVLGIVDQEFAGQLERVFFHDLQRAEEIRLETWRRRPLWRRARERFFRIFEEQL